jgi:hypothetical protein
MRHAAPAAGRPGSRGVSRPIGVGVLVVLALALTSPVVLARGSARDSSDAPRPTSVTGAAGNGRLTLDICERAVSALLAQDLTRVASGMPDVAGPSAVGALAALGGPGTPATVTVVGIHDQLIGPGTTDIINAYQRDVALLLTAYAGRIEAACRQVATT